MKILYIAPDVPIPHTGKFLGGSTHVSKVAESLAESGHEVYIISRRMEKQPKFEKIADRIFIRRFYRGLLFSLESGIKDRKEPILGFTRIIEEIYFIIYRLVLAIYVMWFISKYHFDLVIERNSAKGIGVIPARLLKVRCVVEVIDPDFSKIQLSLASKILTYTRDIIPESLQNKVTLTHAGVDVKHFKPVNGTKIREQYNLIDEKVVIYVGELSEWHGTDVLINIAKKIEDVKFLMVGKNLKLLYKKVKKMGISKKFIFTGFIEHNDVPKYISVADVAVAPYKKTDKMTTFYFSPIKIFEYLACEKPVVASNIEVIDSIIKECKCGLLAKPNDANDFAEKIKVLLNDSRLRKKFGKNGRAVVVSTYTWSKVVEKILEGQNGTTCEKNP